MPAAHREGDAKKGKTGSALPRCNVDLAQPNLHFPAKHHAHRITITGKSYRLKDTGLGRARPAETRPPHDLPYPRGIISVLYALPA
jgi:hypothetical protein